MTETAPPSSDDPRVEALQAAYDPHHAFTFGLERLLDGVAVLVGQRA